MHLRSGPWCNGKLTTGCSQRWKHGALLLPRRLEHSRTARTAPDTSPVPVARSEPSPARFVVLQNESQARGAEPTSDPECTACASIRHRPPTSSGTKCMPDPSKGYGSCDWSPAGAMPNYSLELRHHANWALFFTPPVAMCLIPLLLSDPPFSSNATRITSSPRPAARKTIAQHRPKGSYITPIRSSLGSETEVRRTET